MKASMHSGLAAALVLTLGAVPAAAQLHLNPTRTFGVVTGTLPGKLFAGGAPAGCPVSLKAQHKADGSMVQTSVPAQGGHPKGIGQWLHLAIANPPDRKVAVAQMRVRGFSDKARVTQTTGSAPDASQTVTVPFVSAGQNAEADLWVAGMTAVTSIEVNSVTLDNGAVWTSGYAGCRIEPDPMMPIKGK